MDNPLYYIYCCVLLILAACKPLATPAHTHNRDKVDKSDNVQSDYRQIAEEKLGKGVEFVWNDNRSMVLCVHTDSATAPAMLNRLHFLVILLKDNSVLYEEQIANAQVSWLTATQIKVHTFPGAVRNVPEKKDNYYIYDLKTQQKVSPVSEKF